MSSEYEQLLDDLYEKLPKKQEHTERFEIPKLESFVEGNRTIVKNFKVVCDKLRREPELVMKYLVKKLAVPSGIQGERLILQRKLNEEVLNKRLEEFVEHYVMCKECKRPDTHIDDAGRGTKMLVCESCGAKSTVKE